MEIYGKKGGNMIAVERLKNGRIGIRVCGEHIYYTSFSDYAGLHSYLYNNGFHVFTTERTCIYGNIYFKSNSWPEFIEMITHNELAFQRDGKIYTCWFLAFKPGQIEAKCNCDFAYTNSLGYKAVTLDFKDIIVLKGDI